MTCCSRINHPNDWVCSGRVLVGLSPRPACSVSSGIAGVPIEVPSGGGGGGGTEMPLPPWLEILEARIDEYYQTNGMEAIPPELLNAYSQGLYAEGFLQDALDAADFQATLLSAESGSLLQRNTQLRYDLRQAMGTLNTPIPSEELSNWQQRMEAILIDAAG